MKKVLKKFIILLFTAIFIFCSVTVIKGYAYYKEVTEKFPLENKTKEIFETENYTEIKDMPDIYISAVLAVEDSRFFKHIGIDPIAMARAAKNDIISMSFKEGGSTITQQLAKNLYFTNDKSIVRKIAEMFVSFELEKTYDKKTILELYLNSIYFGENCYCIYDASMIYFNKPPKEMNDFESTLLAGIPNAPSVYSLKQNPDLAYKRQKIVLEKMVRKKFITKEDSQKILDSK